MEFKEFVNNQWTGYGLDIPINYSPILETPTKVITGKIISIYYTKTPISVILDNGYVWRITTEQWDFLTRHKKQPKKNQQVKLEITLDGVIKNIDLV